MKTKRILSALTGAVLASGMLCTTAHATDIDSVYRRTAPWHIVEEHDPEKGWRGCDQSTFLFGFLVRLPEEEPETVLGLPVTHPGSEWDEHAPARIELRSAEEFSEYVQRWDSGSLWGCGELLTSWPPQYQTPEYAVMDARGPVWSGEKAYTRKAQEQLDYLESPESAFALIGAVYVTARCDGDAWGITVELNEDSRGEWQRIKAEYGLTDPQYSPEDGRYSCCSHQEIDRLTKPEAYRAYTDGLYALRDRLRADPRVSDVNVAWDIPCSGADDGTVSIMPVYDFGTGDFNEDGAANIGDAVLLARWLAEDSELPSPTSNGKNLADMDGDTVLDSTDLSALLEQLAGV